MKEAAIQTLLDQCLLTEEEMALGPDKWKETMEDEESIVLELDDGASFNGDAGEEDDLEEEEDIEEEEGPMIPHFGLLHEAPLALLHDGLQHPVAIGLGEPVADQLRSRHPAHKTAVLAHGQALLQD